MESTGVYIILRSKIVGRQLGDAIGLSRLQRQRGAGFHKQTLTTNEEDGEREGGFNQSMSDRCGKCVCEGGVHQFVGSRNHMNVSLTRAKYAMYLVGHFESFEANDEWKMLITDARQRKKIVVVDQSSMKNALRRCLKKG